MQLLADVFKECHRHGEVLLSEGIISVKDIEDAKSGKDNQGVISIGLPAYSILQMLIYSAKADSNGLLLSKSCFCLCLCIRKRVNLGRHGVYLLLLGCAGDNTTEITSTNRPKDTFFDWFLNPLLILKEQIKAENLSPALEDYLGKLVLLSGDPKRLQSFCPENIPEYENKRAELEALARR